MKAEIPGVDAKDIDIALDGRRLTIRGEKKQEKEEKEENFHRTERSYGYFSRIIGMPGEIDSSNVEAKLADGILIIRVSKAEAARPKQIIVK